MSKQENYAYKTQLNTKRPEGSLLSADEDARRHGLHIDCPMDYHTYRLLNDIALRRGISIEKVIGEIVYRQITPLRDKIIDYLNRTGSGMNRLKDQMFNALSISYGTPEYEEAEHILEILVDEGIVGRDDFYYLNDHMATDVYNAYSTGKSLDEVEKINTEERIKQEGK